MRILVDADACPFRHVIVRLAKQHQTQVVWIHSLPHWTDFPAEHEVVCVDSAPEAVDMAIINRIKTGDVVVTQDIGLGALALGKKASALSPRGLIYTETNMDQLLTDRYWSKRTRQAGGRTRGPRPLDHQDEMRFAAALEQLLLTDT